jgi:hypothetical protein
MIYWLVWLSAVTLFLFVVVQHRANLELFSANPAKVDVADLPDPRTVFKGLRELLDKYDNPEVLGHISQVMDKDPGQLARMNLHIQN